MDPRKDPSLYTMQAYMKPVNQDIDNVPPSVAPTPPAGSSVDRLDRLDCTTRLEQIALRNMSYKFINNYVRSPTHFRDIPEDWVSLPAHGFSVMKNAKLNLELDGIVLLSNRVRSTLLHTVQGLISHALNPPVQQYGFKPLAVKPNRPFPSDLGTTHTYAWGPLDAKSSQLLRTTLLVVVVPPWNLTPFHLRQFASFRLSGQDPTMESMMPKVTALWIYIHSLCLHNDVRHWIITTHDHFVFGTFSHHLTQAHQTEPISCQSTNPTILQATLFWTLSSMRLEGSFTHPSVAKECTQRAAIIWNAYQKHARKHGINMLDLENTRSQRANKQHGDVPLYLRRKPGSGPAPGADQDPQLPTDQSFVGHLADVKDEDGPFFRLQNGGKRLGSTSNLLKRIVNDSREESIRSMRIGRETDRHGYTPKNESEQFKRRQHKYHPYPPRPSSRCSSRTSRPRKEHTAAKDEPAKGGLRASGSSKFLTLERLREVPEEEQTSAHMAVKVSEWQKKLKPAPPMDPIELPDNYEEAIAQLARKHEEYGELVRRVGKLEKDRKLPEGDSIQSGESSAPAPNPFSKMDKQSVLDNFRRPVMEKLGPRDSAGIQLRFDAARRVDGTGPGENPSPDDANGNNSDPANFLGSPSQDTGPGDTNSVERKAAKNALDAAFARETQEATIGVEKARFFAVTGSSIDGFQAEAPQSVPADTTNLRQQTTPSPYPANPSPTMTQSHYSFANPEHSTAHSSTTPGHPPITEGSSQATPTFHPGTWGNHMQTPMPTIPIGPTNVMDAMRFGHQPTIAPVPGNWSMVTPPAPQHSGYVTIPISEYLKMSAASNVQTVNPHAYQPLMTPSQINMNGQVFTHTGFSMPQPTMSTHMEDSFSTPGMHFSPSSLFPQTQPDITSNFTDFTTQQANMFVQQTSNHGFDQIFGNLNDFQGLNDSNMQNGGTGFNMGFGLDEGLAPLHNTQTFNATQFGQQSFQQSGFEVPLETFVTLDGTAATSDEEVECSLGVDGQGNSPNGSDAQSSVNGRNIATPGGPSVDPGQPQQDFSFLGHDHGVLGEPHTPGWGGFPDEWYQKSQGSPSQPSAMRNDANPPDMPNYTASTLSSNNTPA